MRPAKKQKQNDVLYMDEKKKKSVCAVCAVCVCVWAGYMHALKFRFDDEL